MRRSVAAALGLVLSASPLSAQVLLRINPPEGQVTHYRMVVEAFMTGGPMAAMITDPSLPMSRMTMYQTRVVMVRAGEQVTFRETLDSAAMESPAMPQMAEAMGQVTASLRGMVTEQVMTARGRILSSRVVSGGPQMAQGRAWEGTNNTENARMLVMLPERPVRPGDSWSDTMTVRTQTGTMTMIGTYRLERMEGSTAVLGTTGTMTSSAGSGGSMTMQMTGEVRFDTSASRIRGFRMDMKGAVPIGQMGDAQMRIRVNGEPIG